MIDVNQNQRSIFSNRILSYFKSNIKEFSEIKVAVWGLSFKPETDDVREAPSIDIIKNLLNNNIEVRAYDPIAIENTKKIINHDKLYFGKDMYDVLNGVDALILCTEWSDFRSPDFVSMKDIMKGHIIFDGKNIFNTKILKELGFRHFQVGVK